MTSIVRKLSQFFLKQFPLDVKERHIPVPQYQDYFDNKFTAILGGYFNSMQDVIDKILLANSLLEHASTILLVGELGLIAIYALGFSIGKMERFTAAKYMT